MRLTGPEAKMSQGSKSPSAPKGFLSSKTRPHLAPSPRPDMVLERKIQRFFNSTTCPPGLMAQGAEAIFERVLWGIYLDSPGRGCSEPERDLSRGAWALHPEPSRASPEVGKAARRVWGSWSEAEGAMGEAFYG